LSRWTAL